MLDIVPIKKNIRKLRKLLKTAPRRPNPDEIHDLRTQIRRLEATLGALRVNRKGNERRLLRHLGRIRKRAGKIRDMDVLTGYASTVQVDQERDCLVQLLEYLGAKRYRRAEQLHARICKYGAELRRRHQPLDGAIATPGYPVTPLGFLALIVIMLVLLVAHSPREAMLGTAVVLTGLPLYQWMLKRGMPQRSAG